MTDVTGSCEVSQSKLDLGAQSATFEVTDIGADGYIYNPADNVDDSITVTIP